MESNSASPTENLSKLRQKGRIETQNPKSKAEFAVFAAHHECLYLLETGPFKGSPRRAWALNLNTSAFNTQEKHKREPAQGTEK